MKDSYWETAEEPKVKSEFGSSDNVNWLKPEDVSAIDQEGNEIACSKCGKKPMMFLMSENQSLAFCEDCYSKLLKVQDEI